MSAQFDLFSPPAPLQSLWDDLEGDPADDPDGLRYYQRDAYNAIMARFREGAKSLLLVMATGTGKAQPNSAKVLTPTGWTTMGALRAGDEVIGSDGRPTRVTGTFPQGSLPVARVTFTDGATTRCCEEHLWAARTKSQASRGADYSIRRAGALARDIRDGSGAVKWFAPVVSPVQFREQCLPVDPWLLGALIGDGCLRKGVRISTVDSHITDRIGALGFALRFLGGCDYSIVQGLVGRNGGPLTNALKSCGAYGFLAHEKRIPALYLVASHAQRLELLRGLMDTDGYCDGKGAEITTSSRGLALDIVELVRSLGGTSKARHRTTTRRDAWRVRVNTPDNPFSMPRKACHYQPNGRAVRSRAFKAIAADGREECTCISVESPDCLYVTDDYILTHNTETFGTVAKHWDGDVLVLAHRDELVEQAVKRLERMTGEYVEIEKAEWTSSPRTRLVVGSIQSFNKKRLERLGRHRFGLIIVDEAHHFLAPSYRRALEWFDAPRLGVTATPDRGDEAALGQIFEDLAYVLDIEEAVDIGYLVPVKGRQVTLSEIHLENVGKSAGDFTIGELDQEMLKAVEGIVHETLRLEPNRPAVCFFPGVRSAEVAAQKFNLMRPDSAAFISGELRQQDPELVRRIVRNFKEGRLQYLCNCMIVTEGFDAPSAALVVQGRPTLSRALYSQMCLDYQTEILSDAGWCRIDDPRPSTVAAFDMDTGAIRMERPVGWTSRTLQPDESMWGIRSPGLDIKVTDGHDMVVRTRVTRAKRRARWNKQKAALVPVAFEIPVSGIADFPGVPLTEHEITFLGLLMTDGCVSKHHGQATLFQSERYPWVCALIEKTLRGCGFKYGHSIETAASNFGPRNWPMHRWTVSRGAPRGRDAHLRGWGAIESWYSKTVADGLSAMTIGQFAALVAAMWAGDGTKKACITDHAPRTFDICSSRKAAVDRLQAMAVVRGWRCNVSHVATNMWMCRLQPGKASRTVNREAADSRPLWKQQSGFTGERVWCVTVPSGAIVTRRDGKVAIVGNCGRGTRPLPGTVDKLPGVHNATARKHAIAQSKKPDCMILDFVGNSTKHSLMTIEDVLGGKYSDEEVTLAKKKRADSGEAKDGRLALIEARRELEALAKATRAKVKAVVRDFDPFAVFGMSLDDEQRYSSRFGLKPASDKQLAVLRKFHMPEEDLAAISKTAASRLIDKIKGRNKAGLANYQQMRHLQQWGITSQEVLYERANEAITYLSQTGFGKRSPVDPAKLQSILFRQRDGGDT